MKSLCDNGYLVTMVSFVAVPSAEKLKKKKSASSWIAHVRAYREKSGCTFREALKAAKDTYTRKPARVKKDRSEYKPNPWLLHIKKTMKDNPKWKELQSYKQLLVACKATYKKAAVP